LNPPGIDFNPFGLNLLEQFSLVVTLTLSEMPDTTREAARNPAMTSTQGRGYRVVPETTRAAISSNSALLAKVPERFYRKQNMDIVTANRGWFWARTKVR